MRSFLRFSARFLLVLGLAFSLKTYGVMPSNPATDSNFLLLSDGTNLEEVVVQGSYLYLATGVGASFTATLKNKFVQLKRETQRLAGHKIQWVLMDLDSHRVLDQSQSPNLKVFGASVSKIYVAATLLDKQSGHLSAQQFQLMSDMLVVSSNTAWVNLQTQIGDGDPNLGRKTIHEFTQRMGYQRTRGFQGYWGDVHGNELTAKELAEFLHDTYQARYPGAETVWKLMYTGRTGNARGKKYIPSNIFVSGKTGTYDGPTVNPETGSDKNADGSPYKVRVRSHIIAFYANGKVYGLSILADTGSDESAALLAGGLIREYAIGF